MTTLREAAQQALEAIYTAEALLLSMGMDSSDAYQEADAAITALNAALAEPMQEPVAWMYDWEAEEETITNWLTSDYDEAHSPTMRCTNIRPLYTAPPQRKPLTDEEIALISIECAASHKNDDIQFARAIIAKVTGEKE